MQVGAVDLPVTHLTAVIARVVLPRPRRVVRGGQRLGHQPTAPHEPRRPHGTCACWRPVNHRTKDLVVVVLRLRTGVHWPLRLMPLPRRLALALLPQHRWRLVCRQSRAPLLWRPGHGTSAARTAAPSGRACRSQHHGRRRHSAAPHQLLLLLDGRRVVHRSLHCRRRARPSPLSAVHMPLPPRGLVQLCAGELNLRDVLAEEGSALGREAPDVAARRRRRRRRALGGPARRRPRSGREGGSA